MAESRFELLEMDGDGAERIAEYVTLKEGLADLIERVRLSVTLGEDAWPLYICNVCLVEIPDGLAYVNLTCNVTGERRFHEDAYQLVAGRPEEIQANFSTIEQGLEEISRRMNESIEARRPAEFGLVRGQTYICIVETFQAGIE